MGNDTYQWPDGTDIEPWSPSGDNHTNLVEYEDGSFRATLHGSETLNSEAVREGEDRGFCRLIATVPGGYEAAEAYKDELLKLLEEIENAHLRG